MLMSVGSKSSFLSLVISYESVTSPKFVALLKKFVYIEPPHFLDFIHFDANHESAIKSCTVWG